jgi:hypothetical protein
MEDSTVLLDGITVEANNYLPYRYQFKESFDVEVSLVQNKEK